MLIIVCLQSRNDIITRTMWNATDVTCALESHWAHSGLIGTLSISKPLVIRGRWKRNIETMLKQWWDSVVDDGPQLRQHWFDVCWLIRQDKRRRLRNPVSTCWISFRYSALRRAQVSLPSCLDCRRVSLTVLPVLRVVANSRGAARLLMYHHTLWWVWFQNMLS